jgi:hypothetical protein
MCNTRVCVTQALIQQGRLGLRLPLNEFVHFSLFSK